MFRKSLMALAIASLTVGSAWAAVSAEEAKQLGTTLTPTGAEKAGNKDGTIPEWTGGLTTMPPGFQKSTNKRVDPFASEKPRLVITAKDVAANADKLTEGTKALLNRYPTMRLDVYPTHRTVYFPARVVENTHKNVLTAKTNNGGLGLENALPGYPFPIPKTGYEAMWNHLLAYKGLGWQGKYDSWNVDSSGTASLATTGDVVFAWPMYDPNVKGFLKDPGTYYNVKLFYLAPARRNGESILVLDSANPLENPRRAWQYLPGQRRVKLAPDISYDTPNPGAAGAATYDDTTVFNGAMDRYDFKLIGKKEMYVPYSNYRLHYYALPAEIMKPGHINADLVRWELHRVWVVEATLKPDKRHIYTRRLFYLDEDSWSALASDNYDARGQLYRSVFNHQDFAYDVPAPYNDSVASYDFVAGMYNMTGIGGPHNGLKYWTEMPPDSYWAPEALAGSGIR